MLTPFADELWIDTRRVRFFGVETGTRMTVVRLADGGLFVHSPVALSEDTRREIDSLGEVRAVVAPSLFHHLYFGEWIAAYPKAVFAACEGLDRRRKDLSFNHTLGDVAHAAWAGELEQVYFSARRENEVDFYHIRSRTLICTDALLNLSTHDYRSTRAVAWLMGNSAPGLGWVEPLMVRDRALARRQVDRMLEWDIDKTVLAHGAVVHARGGDVLREAYRWLG